MKIYDLDLSILKGSELQKKKLKNKIKEKHKVKFRVIYNSLSSNIC